MAASVSLSNPLSLYNPHTFTRFPSKPTNQFSLKHTNSQQFIIFTKKPFSRQPFSSPYPALNAHKESGVSRNINYVYKDKNGSFFQPSVSAQQENQQQTDHEEGSVDPNKKFPSNMKSLMQMYKEAIFEGNDETIYEIEDFIFTIEKEKDELAREVSAMSTEICSEKEKYLRVHADFKNYRKRSEEEKLTVRNDARGEVVESLLPIVDSFERAKQQLELDTEREKKIDTSYQGIYKQFVEIMRSLRVSVVPTVGKPFDPSMHEAVAREVSLEFKEGVVIQEFRRGFYLEGRLLRPATVKVSSGPGYNNKAKSISEQSFVQHAPINSSSF